MLHYPRINLQSIRRQLHLNKATFRKPRLPHNIVLKGGKILKNVSNILNDVSSVKKVVGNFECSITELKRKLKKEKYTYQKMVKRAGTQAKKLIMQKGGYLEQAEDVKTKKMKELKDDYDKLMLQAQLHVLIELNNRL